MAKTIQRTLDTVFAGIRLTSGRWAAVGSRTRLARAAGRRSRTLQPYVDDLDQADEALRRLAVLYATGQIPNTETIVDTIIPWGEAILSPLPGRRASNGPLEGINNLL